MMNRLTHALAPVPAAFPAPSPERVGRALREAASPTSRWPFLDGARGVAMIAVFGFHALRIVGDWYSPKILGEGVPMVLWPAGVTRFAIDVFFVLSGFLVLTTWRARRRRHATTWPALRDYVRGRAFRILPVFWLSVLVLVPLRAPGMLTSPGDLALVSTLQQYMDPSLPGRFNVVTWSLTVEGHFYILLPVLALLTYRRFGGPALLAGAVLLTVGWEAARGGLPSSLIVGRLDQFVAGMLVAEVYRRHQEGGRSTVVRLALARGVGLLLGLVLLAVGVYHGQLLGIPPGTWFDGWQHPVAGLAIAGLGLRLLCQAEAGRLRRFLERPSLVLVGTLSYSIYLWHLPILEGVLHTLEPFSSWMPVVDDALGVGLAVALSLGVAALSYTYVELPFMRRTRRRSRDGERRRDAEPVASAAASRP